MDDNAKFVAEPLGSSPSDGDRVLLFDRDFNLRARGDGDVWWSRAEIEGRVSVRELLPVGRLGRRGVFAGQYSDGHESALSLRSVFPGIDPGERAALSAAKQRLHWIQDHHYCGRCGRETVWHQTEYTRYCAYCRHRQYPRLSPCVIVAIQDGDWMLLGRSHRHPPDLWTLIAGFIEPGESAEEAVVREVAEETGVSVSGLCYRASESWPFPHQLMLGYTACYAGGTLVRAEDELAALDWFHRDRLPGVPGDWTIAGRLIRTLSGNASDD